MSFERLFDGLFGYEIVPAAPARDPAQKAQIEQLAQQIQEQGSLGADAHVKLARAYIALGRHDLAVKNLDAAKDIKPTVAVDPRLEEAIKGSPQG